MPFETERPLYQQLRLRFEEIWPYVQHGTTLDALLRALQRDLLDEVEANRWTIQTESPSSSDK